MIYHYLSKILGTFKMFSQNKSKLVHDRLCIYLDDDTVTHLQSETNYFNTSKLLWDQTENDSRQLFLKKMKMTNEELLAEEFSIGKTAMEEKILEKKIQLEEAYPNPADSKFYYILLLTELLFKGRLNNVRLSKTFGNGHTKAKLDEIAKLDMIEIIGCSEIPADVMSEINELEKALDQVKWDTHVSSEKVYRIMILYEHKNCLQVYTCIFTGTTQPTDSPMIDISKKIYHYHFD